MSISINEVEHVADLARLKLNEREKQQFAEQLSVVLNYIEKLKELDTTHVAPTTHVLSLVNVMRDDVHRPSWPIEQVMANAPDEEDGQFKVPAVLD